MAFDQKDRYFQSTMYNMTRVVNRLADLVEEKGGTVLRHSDERLIHTRGFDESIQRLEKQIISINEEINRTPFWEEQKKLKKTREQTMVEFKILEAEEKNSPVVSTRFVSLVSDLWIKFKLDGYQYYFGVDTNPFFRDSWSKGKTNSDRTIYLDEIDAGDKFYYTNDMFTPVADEETIETAAKGLLEFFEKAETTDTKFY